MLKDYARYYVYAYLRNDGSPYYIGKGKGYRAWHKGYGEVKPPKNKEYVKILAKDLLEFESLALEKKLINYYGRKDTGTGILRNKADGGLGSPGYRHSEEALQKISKASKGRRCTHTEKTKEKLRQINLGKKRTAESIEKTRQGCLGKKRTPEQIANIKANSGRRKKEEKVC